MLTKFFKNSSSDIGNLLFMMIYKESSGFFCSRDFSSACSLLEPPTANGSRPTGLLYRFGRESVWRLEQCKVGLFRSCHREIWGRLEAVIEHWGRLEAVIEQFGGV